MLYQQNCLASRAWFCLKDYSAHISSSDILIIHHPSHTVSKWAASRSRHVATAQKVEMAQHQKFWRSVPWPLQSLSCYLRPCVLICPHYPSYLWSPSPFVWCQANFWWGRDKRRWDFVGERFVEVETSDKSARIAFRCAHCRESRNRGLNKTKSSVGRIC